MGEENKQEQPPAEHFERRVEGDQHAKRGSLEAQQKPIVVAPADAPTGPPQAQIEASRPSGAEAPPVE
jgi:hypothetical protein